MRELARAVKSGGRIIVSDIHPFNVLLGGQAAFPIADGEMGIVRNREHSIGAYVEAARAAGLEISACIEPAFREEDVEKIVGRYEDRYGPGFVDACKEGLVGFPMVLIWDLRKRVT